jgi:hypothetical protein
MTQRVQVLRVQIPAMSTVGTATGRTDDGAEIQFAEGHRYMRNLGEWMQAQWPEPTFVDVEDWQILGLKNPERFQ